jgi:hypothetical protein
MLGAVGAALTFLRPAQPAQRYDAGDLVIRGAPMAPAH